MHSNLYHPAWIIILILIELRLNRYEFVYYILYKLTNFIKLDRVMGFFFF